MILAVITDAFQCTQVRPCRARPGCIYLCVLFCFGLPLFCLSACVCGFYVLFVGFFLNYSFRRKTLGGEMVDREKDGKTEVGRSTHTQATKQHPPPPPPPPPNKFIKIKIALFLLFHYVSQIWHVVFRSLEKVEFYPS